MSATRWSLRGVLYALFALSGFAGLIYESIWSHYLKLFLGHAAYAQTLVLCIFMGGMALGSALVGRYSHAIRHPLLVYAAVEALLGCAALGFDGLFRPLHAWLFHQVLPDLGTPFAVDLAKWSLAVATILPQSILLGATFPLISAAVVRLNPAAAGNTLGWLYFTNSIGAAVGVLVSGFVLIDKVGLPGTILTAGLVNFMLGLVVYLLNKRMPVPQAIDGTENSAVRNGGGKQLTGLLIWTAALTGAASFFYEIAWIRMLSLVIGSATHSFELMLSAFITGLAFGSFFIRRRIDVIADVRPLLGRIQIVMGLLAVFTIPVYMQLFDAMAWWMEAIRRNEAGYVLFTLFAHVLCFLIMLPATVCAGMTLPLITAALIRDGGGEREIGRVYANNTLGAITGVIVAVHLVMPHFGLRSVVLTGAAIDIGLGIALLLSCRALAGGWVRAGLAAAAVLILAVVVAVPFDPRITASGVYRQGLPHRPGESVFHKDGKTATVDVVRGEVEGTTSGKMSIITNGKVDAGLQLDVDATPQPDDYTMLLAALLPLSINSLSQDVAVIGIGSGRTTHGLLHAQGLKSVDTIEIEPAMVEGARLFGPITGKTYSDPRSRIYIEDAKAHFSRVGKSYDFIVSEPSNPWVSGTSNLFTVEFYSEVKRYLRPGGLLVQWIQLYEMDLKLIATVVNALSSEFKDYVIYVTFHGDVLIVASPDQKVPKPNAKVLQDAGLVSLWKLLGINNEHDLEVRRIGDRSTMEPWMREINSSVNSDYFPILDQNAVLRRFMDVNALEMYGIYPYSARLENGSARGISKISGVVSGLDHSVLAVAAAKLSRFNAWSEGRADMAAPLVAREIINLYENLWSIERNCTQATLNAIWLPAVQFLTMQYAVYMPLDEVARISERLRKSRCWSETSAEARHWLELFEAIGTDHWVGIQSAASALLALNPDASPAKTFVIAELLLADLKVGGKGLARARVQSLKHEKVNSTPIRYLLANIGA